MTAEELVGLIREVDSWDLGKVLRVFDGEGIYGYLVKYEANKFAEKVKNESRLTIDDLKVGDIIERNATRYVVLAIENNAYGLKGAYVMTNENTTRYIVNLDIADFKKTQLNVESSVNIIKMILKEG